MAVYETNQVVQKHATVTNSPTPPKDPQHGDMWFDGSIKRWFNADINEWVETDLTGPPGETGNGVESVETTYQFGDSGTIKPTGTWSSSIPTPQKNKYLWTKFKTIYTDKSENETFLVTYYPADGVPGEAGPPGNNGTNALNGYLTNESLVMFANSSGVVSDFSNAKGEFKVFDGSIEVLTGLTFTKISESGCTSTINATTGAYAITAMSADVGTVTYQATYKGALIKKILMIVKNKQGVQGPVGPDGKPTGIIESATAPANPYEGMLWKDTLVGITKIRRGNAWANYIFAADNIVAENLSALSVKTGNLEVNGSMEITQVNGGIKGTYDFGNPDEFQPRWLVGKWSAGQRFIGFEADIYTIKNGAKEFRIGYATSYYGAGYFKMRDYAYNNPNDPTQKVLRSRVDFAVSDVGVYYLQFAGDWSPNSGTIISSTEVATPTLAAGSIDVKSGLNEINFNSSRTDIADFNIGKDTTGKRLWSQAVFDRTSSSASNLYITSYGTFARSTSARKYKLLIEESTEVISKAKKVLKLNPASWYDKAEIEAIAKSKTTGEPLEDEEKIRRYHGFIADEFDELGLTEVVSYNANGEVESLAYDRLTMYYHVLIKDLYSEIEKLKGAK